MTGTEVNNERSSRIRTVVALTLLASCGAEEQGPEGLARALASVMATCSSTSGEVQVRRSGEGFWTAAATGVLFQPGDWVRTARASHARIEFRSGGALDVEEDAVVVIEAIETAELPDGATAQPLVAVQRGVVRGSFAPGAEGRTGSTWYVKAADGSRVRLARKGTGEVEIKLTQNGGRTEFAVSKGSATVALAGKQEEIFATGMAAKVAGGQMDSIAPLQTPAPLQPPADARLLFDPTTAVRLSWGQVANAKGYRVQIANDAAFQDVGQTAEAQVDSTLLVPKGPGVTFFRVAARDADGRLWEFGPSRRLFFERAAPRDLLTAPAPGATFGHPGTSPRILFSWTSVEGARSYRLMVTTGNDFFAPAVLSEVTTSDHLVVDTLAPGAYRWGVWTVDEAPQPLFLTPRSLNIKRVAGLRAPRVITKWGDK